MRALIINGVCAALALTGCTSKASMSLVVVSVDADAPLADIATLHARVTVGDQSREFDVHPTGGAALSVPPAQSFGIEIPRTMTGTLSVHVEARDSNGTVTAAGDGSGPIRPGARADISVQLAANGLGDLGGIEASDMATTPSDLGGDMVVIPPAMLTIDKTTQSFGDITVGKTSTTASFLVINDGGMPSSVAMLTKSGPNVAEFTIDTDCGPALAPGGRCHVTASVAPTSAGAKTATFTLAAAQGGSVGGTLTANALTPGDIKIVQPTGNCGSALVGVQSTTTASFTVQNKGASPTTALSVMMSDPQFQATGCNGSTLAAGGMCTVTVKFTPSASGTQNASLNVSATMGGTDTASVVGVGLKPASLKLAPPSYTFSNAARGSTGETATFTVSNVGDVDSPTMSAATLTGANPSSFAITADNCKGAPVGPAPASCTIKVQFTPQLTGTNVATFNINTSAATAIMAAVTGTGMPIWVQEATDLTLQPLNAVWAADSTHVYAVGNAGTIVYRDATGKWLPRTLSASANPLPDLRSVSGSSSTDVYVAGGGIFQSSNNSTWTSWQMGSFTGVFVFGPGDVWGSYYFLNGNTPESAIYHFVSSTGWTQVTNASGGAAIGLARLWGTSAADLYSYGQELQCGLGNCTSYEVIVHPNSSGDWVRQYQVSVPGPSAQINSLWGFGAPATDLYATVYGFTVPLHSTGNGDWVAMDSGAPKGCAAVWGADKAHVWFGCATGLYAYKGSNWISPVLTTEKIQGLHGTGVDNVYAVGNDGSSSGVIYHYY
ncbi:MAG: hypothetical protein JWM53_3585 [bacterium]|jgi:hypothetical protein|nr:hypothetical protein [bacterium]